MATLANGRPVTSGLVSPRYPTSLSGGPGASSARSSGEFAFQIKFKRREDLNDQALRRAEAFFLGLQDAAKDWIALGATKTGVVHRLKGNPPNAHE
jgi:hypothetical protein